jgi:hypothetical protein
MAQMSWTTRWESWRELMGRSGTPQRRRVDAFLQTHPAMLYWGDSWFSTPLYLNLARQSLLQITGMAMVVGKPGATASDLFAPNEVDRMIDRINGSPFDVLCLSAGGNDQLSERLAQSFRAWQPPAQRPKITGQAASTCSCRPADSRPCWRATRACSMRCDARCCRVGPRSASSATRTRRCNASACRPI